MAINDKYGDGSDDDLDFNFDDVDFDDVGGFDDPSDRKPKTKLSEFRSALKEEAFSPQSRRRLIRDSIPSQYHSTLSAAETITEAGADLYNDAVVKEWEKSRGLLKKAARINSQTLRKFGMSRIADWAESTDYSGGYEIDAEELDVLGQLDIFKGGLKEALDAAKAKSIEQNRLSEEEYKASEDRQEAEDNYRDVTIKQGNANFGILSKLLQNSNRAIDYQDQITFNYHKKAIELNIRSLMLARKDFELQSILRAELKEGLAAIVKNTSLPDYLKITSEENAKRVLRDKFVSRASDWAGNKLGSVMTAFINQTRRNIATGGDNLRNFLDTYIDQVEAGEDAGMKQSDVISNILMSIAAGRAVSTGSRIIGGQISKRIAGNRRLSQAFDLSEAILANGGSFANMALSGRSGYGGLDKLMEAGGYSSLGQNVRTRIGESNASRLDHAAFLDNSVKRAIVDVIPNWLGRIWKAVEATARGISPDKIEDEKYDLRFNRFRKLKELQTEFNTQTFDEDKIQNYNDGMDRWIDNLDPDHTLSPEARSVIRKWLVTNHAKGLESFPVALYKGDGLPSNVSRNVKKELEYKIPILAGFDPFKVDRIQKDGIALETQVLRENPSYRRRATTLAYIDQESRTRMPIDNQKLAEMTEKYGYQTAVNSKLAKYDEEGNLHLNNQSLIDLVTSGGYRPYRQRNELTDEQGNVREIAQGFDDDAPRRPVVKLNNGLSGNQKEAWLKDILHRMNVPGFARGGFTKGDPDQVAGVTHGGETVINSTATKENARILGYMNKLSAPLTLAGGKLNRVYFKALGFNSPEEVDQVNEFKSNGLGSDLIHGRVDVNRIHQNVKQQAQGRFDRLKNRVWYQDGFNTSMGPVPEFIGPVRQGGLKNNLNNSQQAIFNYMNQRDEKGRLFNLSHRTSQAKDLARSTMHRMENYDYQGALQRGQDSLNNYKTRAKEALRKANTSKSLDFDATHKAIEDSIRRGDYQHEDESLSLYLTGMRSPFITKGDFAVGRFRSRLSGRVISKLADITDDIVLVDSHGNYTTVATMADMLEGVFDGRGRPVRLIGLEEGHRRYLKRTTMMGAAIKNSQVGRFALALKDKIWDDHPVDVCVFQNGELTVVLKASNFLAGRYLDKETRDVLKSHNDIRGEVIDIDGATKLTLEELAGGIYSTDGKRLKISYIKHIRNKIVTKIENKVGKIYGSVKDKVLNRGLSYLEGKQDNQVYVSRYMGNGEYRIVPSFTLQDLKDGILRGVYSGAVFTKLSEIKEPVYSTKTKSVVAKQEEVDKGFMNKDGQPFKDRSNMTIESRIRDQQERAVNFLSTKFKSFTSNVRDGYREALNQVDIYVKGEPVPRITAEQLKNGNYVTVVEVKDGGETDFSFNVVKSYKDIAGVVVKDRTDNDPGKEVITKDDLEKGLVDSKGNVLETQYSKYKSTSNRSGGILRGVLSRIKDKMKRSSMKNLYLRSDMSTPVFPASKLNAGKIINIKTRKVVVAYSDLTGGAMDVDDESNIVSADQVKDLVFEDGSPVPLSKGLLGRTKSIISGIGGKLRGLRMGSWQWLRARKEEEARNRKQDINVNVDNGGKEKKGFLGKLLTGLGGLFGGLFTTAFLKLKSMFKSIRNAILISKAATGLGGILGGVGGRGKAALIAKLAGAGLVGYGGYKAYNAFDDAEADVLDDHPKGTIPKTAEEEQSFLSKADDAVGGMGSEVALMGGMALAGKGIKRLRNGPMVGPKQPGILRRAASRIGGHFGRQVGAGVSDAARTTRGAGKLGGRFLGGIAKRLPGVARFGGKVLGGIHRGVMSATSPTKALRALTTLGRGALTVGRIGLGIARFMTGPVGLAIGAAVWIGGALYSNYKNKQNPLMRFRMKQYGFDFDDQDYTTKFLDLENLLKDHVTVDAKGIPTIKESFPEDKVLELFEVNPDDPNDQEHVQRFITWWIKRFKPVYLSYVKQTYQILKKTDISVIDEELSKKDKLKLLKGVHFVNKQNNPYAIQVSPFKTPETVDLTLPDVEDAYETCLKFINKMPDDKKTSAIDKAKENEDKTPDGKPVSKTPGTWLEATKQGLKELGNNTLKFGSLMADKTSDLFTNWFDKASTNIKGMWDGMKDWFSSATDGLTNAMSKAWNKVKSFGGGVAETASNVGSAVIDAGSSVVHGVADFATGTYEKLTGKTKDNQLMVYKAFRTAGLSDNQAKILTAEVGRENDYQSKYLWGGHVDANNGAQNLGMISWQKGRATALSKRLRAKGLIDSNGNMVKSQEALNEQARYLVDEINNNKDYARTKQVFLSNPNVPYKTASEVLGRNFIRWDYDGRKINPTSHHQKRDKYFAQISQVAGSAGSVSSGGSVSAPAAPGSGVLASSSKKTIVSQDEMAKLSKAAPKPASPLGPKAMADWEKGETERKAKLRSIQQGVLKGTHEVSGQVKGSDANATGKKDPSKLETAKQQASAKFGPTNPTPEAPKGNIPEWMKIAWQEEKRGISEATNGARISQYFSDIGLSNAGGDLSWCAAFVSWCLREAGVPFNTANPASAKGYTNFGKGMGKNDIPYGSIVVVAPSHVFFCVGQDGDWVKGLGGNQGNPGRVKVSNFKKDTIIAVRYPDGQSVSSPAGTTKPNTVNNPNAAMVLQRNSGTDANLNNLSEPVTKPTRRTGVSQSTAATQQVEADNQTKSGQDSNNIYIDQLNESRKQTKLLEGIYESVTGHRSDNLEANKQAVNARNGEVNHQATQTEMIAGAVNALVKSLTEMNKNQNKGSLGSRFPIDASK